MVTLNVQDFTNVGDYLRTFLQALNQESAGRGDETFEIESRDAGLTRAETQMLR